MKITDWNVRAFDVPMRSPYRSAQRTTTTAHNVLLIVTVDGEHAGVGESAPATYVTGETQEIVRTAIERFFSGHAPDSPESVLARAQTDLAASPGALGAVEIAVQDAVARANGVPLYRLLNHATSTEPGILRRTTDLSLPLLSPEEAGRRAADAHGFRAFKIKVGVGDIAEDVARVRAVADAAPHSTLRLDGNQAFTPATAFALLDGLTDLFARIELFEQPTAANDDAAMLAVHRALPNAIPVFADESCHDAEDARRLIEGGICGGVVLKLAKSGLSGASKIVKAVREAGGTCLFGCMMETRIGIGAALHLAVALGETVVPMLDLDGHLLTYDAGLLTGGFTQIADVLEIAPGTLGLGVSVVDV
ncbi:MAG: hypothetical protein H7Y38_10175 [Armatimonadetes bacterium]|nr:hypothetical protein [Armatimonadota bacterium]